MTLSTGLIRRLTSDSSDEPLAKRVKLAENVFCSPDLPIICKEDCIFRWLCHELSAENITVIWPTIHRCLALEPKSFSRLSPEVKTVLIEKLITALDEYKQNQVLEWALKCCKYIFSNTNVQSYSKEAKTIYLMQTIIAFTSKSFHLDKSEIINELSNLALECTEYVISTFTQVCRHNFSEKRNLTTIFIEQLLFPLGFLIETIRLKKVPSKLFIETEKCIKRLLLGSLRNITICSGKSKENNEKSEEAKIIFDTLKNKANQIKAEYVKAAFTCLFQCAVNNFQQNSALVDVILRKLVTCIEHKEQSKQILIALLKNSADVSYNFDNEIEGISLKSFLKTLIDETISKKKRFKYADYDLLGTVAKLNPLIVEDVTQNILERICFEDKANEQEEEAYENLVTELWKSSVRLRRQHKFISKFLLTISKYDGNKIEDIEFRNKFELPKHFVSEFSQDLKNRTTFAQVLAMLHTLIFHLKSDCVTKKSSEALACLMTKIVTKLFIILFEHSNFLDNSLPHDVQIKFYHAFTDLKNILSLFADNLCEDIDIYGATSFIAFCSLTKVWCEAYDLLRYYFPNIVSEELDFPLNELQLKKLKNIVKNYKEQDCKESLNHLLLMKSKIFDKDRQIITEKIIARLWPVILENHFNIIESLTEEQILQLTAYFVNEANSTQDKLTKWISILKLNISRMTKLFTTCIALVIISFIAEDIDCCVTKTAIEKIILEDILLLHDEPENIKKYLKSAKKEISKQDFKPLKVVPNNKTKRNLTLLSSLPLSFLDTNIRTFLFLILYSFEEETKNTTNFKELIINIYTDLLLQNDVDILNDLSKPRLLIKHFTESEIILSKLFKLSLSKLSDSTFWNDFIEHEECNRRISCILLTCIDSIKNRTSSSEQKNVLHNLSLKLSSKIIEENQEEINNSNEIAGLRISLKLVLSDKNKIKSTLKKCVELALKKVIQDAETVTDSKLIQESLQLALVVLSHRENFNSNEEVVNKLCIIFINNPNGKIFSHFLEVLKDEEFEFFAKYLSNQTKESLKSGDIHLLEKLIIIWENLSKAETKATRSKQLSSFVNNLFTDLLCTEINEVSSVFLLRIWRAFIVSKRMIKLTDRIIDSIFVTSTQCLNNLCKDAKLITCQESLGLCSDFVRSKADFVLDRLPILTHFFRKIIQIVLQEGKETDFSDEQMLRILAIDIEKFCTFFAKLKKDVVRISPYLIADLIKEKTHVGVLPPFLKASLESSICSLLSNCDRHAISFLSRILPTSTQQVFKNIHDNYTKYHKFTGKI